MMSSLKGQYIYQVCEYDKHGTVQSIDLYANRNDAEKAVKDINREAKQYGGFGDYDRTKIN